MVLGFTLKKEFKHVLIENGEIEFWDESKAHSNFGDFSERQKIDAKVESLTPRSNSPPKVTLFWLRAWWKKFNPVDTKNDDCEKQNESLLIALFLDLSECQDSDAKIRSCGRFLNQTFVLEVALLIGQDIIEEKINFVLQEKWDFHYPNKESLTALFAEVSYCSDSNGRVKFSVFSIKYITSLMSWILSLMAENKPAFTEKNDFANRDKAIKILVFGILRQSGFWWNARKNILNCRFFYKNEIIDR